MIIKMVAIVLAIALVVSGVCKAAPGPGRIVGGSPATVEQYPGIVQVSDFQSSTGTWCQSCGGNILTERTVLSAAHCLDQNNPSSHVIRAGANIRHTGGIIVYIFRILHHEYYRGNPLQDGDIAIVTLASYLVFGPTINAVSIPPQGFIVPGNSPGYYAGWGFNYEGSDHLMQVDVNILSHEECERRYGLSMWTDNVCAGYDGKDGCEGDSGGPLYYGGVLVGIVATGPFPCGHVTKPGVNIRVGAYTDWIIANA